ncbi:hypothetical protein MMPV_002733 [Pyropia vietnamensis]
MAGPPPWAVVPPHVLDLRRFLVAVLTDTGGAPPSWAAVAARWGSARFGLLHVTPPRTLHPAVALPGHAPAAVSAAALLTLYGLYVSQPRGGGGVVRAAPPPAPRPPVRIRLLPGEEAAVAALVAIPPGGGDGPAGGPLGTPATPTASPAVSDAAGGDRLGADAAAAVAALTRAAAWAPVAAGGHGPAVVPAVAPTVVPGTRGSRLLRGTANWWSAADGRGWGGGKEGGGGHDKGEGEAERGDDGEDLVAAWGAPVADEERRWWAAVLAADAATAGGGGRWWVPSTSAAAARAASATTAAATTPAPDLGTVAAVEGALAEATAAARERAWGPAGPPPVPFSDGQVWPPTGAATATVVPVLRTNEPTDAATDSTAPPAHGGGDSVAAAAAAIAAYAASRDAAGAAAATAAGPARVSASVGMVLLRHLRAAEAEATAGGTPSRRGG